MKDQRTAPCMIFTLYFAIGLLRLALIRRVRDGCEHLWQGEGRVAVSWGGEVAPARHSFTPSTPQLSDVDTRSRHASPSPCCTPRASMWQMLKRWCRFRVPHSNKLVVARCLVRHSRPTRSNAATLYAPSDAFAASYNSKSVWVAHNASHTGSLMPQLRLGTI